MNKKVLWMLIADIANPQVHLVSPTLAWMAKDAGVEFECYFESPRDGKLFAGTGSTILGGYHHQQFNYINSVFEVKYILYGKTSVFKSTINMLQADILIESESILEIYNAILNQPGVNSPNEIILAPLIKEIAFLPVSGTRVEMNNMEIGPYLYPEIFFRKALAFPATLANKQTTIINQFQNIRKSYIYLSDIEKKVAADFVSQAFEIDKINEKDSYPELTTRISNRWKHMAKGVTFGDPAIILSLLPTLCREQRLSLYGQLVRKPLSQIKTSWYVEDSSEISEEVANLANEIGNPIILGRQTGDGDIFEWSKKGVCIKIADPNRPAFPIVSTIKHSWHGNYNIYADEPDDAALERYAKEGKVLATILWHSGEIAHNEAMLNLFDLASYTGIKIGIGVHVSRYETCPQMWELLNIPQNKGGVKGLVEPLLHSGGWGVMAEVNCPPEKLALYCKKAIERIEEIAGNGSLPKGYLAFMDTDLDTLSPGNSEIYTAIASSGLDYVISSSLPGRNRVLYEVGDFRVLNQSCRTIMNSSPFVRITTEEDIPNSDNKFAPAWMIGTMDAPVICFNPYIWKHGSRFMRIVDWLLNGEDVINVLPSTIARYSKVLKNLGFLPQDNISRLS